jgi:hypothetical protein
MYHGPGFDRHVLRINGCGLAREAGSPVTNSVFGPDSINHVATSAGCMHPNILTSKKDDPPSGNPLHPGRSVGAAALHSVLYQDMLITLC